MHRWEPLKKNSRLANSRGKETHCVDKEWRWHMMASLLAKYLCMEIYIYTFIHTSHCHIIFTSCIYVLLASLRFKSTCPSIIKHASTYNVFILVFHLFSPCTTICLQHVDNQPYICFIWFSPHFRCEKSPVFFFQSALSSFHPFRWRFSSRGIASRHRIQKNPRFRSL